MLHAASDHKICAVQIIEIPPNVSPTVTAVDQAGQEIDDMPVEALLGMDMAHPNVVQTYRHTSLNSMVRPAPLLCTSIMRVHNCCILHVLISQVHSILQQS